jgi:hypothetical protein
MPDRQQLVLLVGPLVLAGALERLGQQRVREHLARDPLRVQRVGLPALTRTIVARRAVRAHIAHVIATPYEEHGGVAPPARGALHPPAAGRPELLGPRLQRAMPIARHAEVLAGHDPAPGIDDRRGQRLLVRIDPDDVARVIGRNQQVRRSRTALGCSSHHLTFPGAFTLWADRPTTSR